MFDPIKAIVSSLILAVLIGAGLYVYHLKSTRDSLQKQVVELQVQLQSSKVNALVTEKQLSDISKKSAEQSKRLSQAIKDLAKERQTYQTESQRLANLKTLGSCEADVDRAFTEAQSLVKAHGEKP